VSVLYIANVSDSRVAMDGNTFQSCSVGMSGSIDCADRNLRRAVWKRVRRRRVGVLRPPRHVPPPSSECGVVVRRTICSRDSVIDARSSK